MSQEPGLARLQGMLKWLIRNRIAAFEKQFDYDMTYARELLATDLGAFFALAKVQAMGNYAKGVPKEVRYAAKLVGTMAEDCGPCTQLMVTMAFRDGVAPPQLAAVLRSDDDAMTGDVRLAVTFARAALAHEAAADELREQVVAKWGKKGLATLAFSLAVARVYPTVKYALGHGKACRRIVVAGAPIGVVRSAA